jgi:hypothetical protein
MTNRLLALLLTVAFAIAFPLSAEAYLLLGERGSSCGTWTAARKTSRDYFPMAAWVLGYLAGIASSTGEDLMRGIDSAAVDAWVDKYCAEHPLNKVSDAANVLADELIARQKRPTKK